MANSQPPVVLSGGPRVPQEVDGERVTPLVPERPTNVGADPKADRLPDSEYDLLGLAGTPDPMRSRVLGYPERIRHGGPDLIIPTDPEVDRVGCMITRSGPQPWTIPANAVPLPIENGRVRESGVYRLSGVVGPFSVTAPDVHIFCEPDALVDGGLRNGPTTIDIATSARGFHFTGGTVRGTQRVVGREGQTGQHCFAVQTSEVDIESVVIYADGAAGTHTTKEGVQVLRNKSIRDVRVSYCDISGVVDGMSLQGGENMTVHGCRIHDVWDDGIEFDYSTSGSVTDTVFWNTVYSNVSWQGQPTGLAGNGSLGRYTVSNCQLTGTCYRHRYFDQEQFAGGSPFKARAGVLVDILDCTILGLGTGWYADRFFIAPPDGERPSEIRRNLFILRGKSASLFARVGNERLPIILDENAYDVESGRLWAYPGMLTLQQLQASGFESNGIDLRQSYML